MPTRPQTNRGPGTVGTSEGRKPSNEKDLPAGIDGPNEMKYWQLWVLILLCGIALAYVFNSPWAAKPADSPSAESMAPVEAPAGPESR